jgi:uncharacterized protein involved in exopolysaccharide biosynthesis
MVGNKPQAAAGVKYEVGPMISKHDARLLEPPDHDHLPLDEFDAQMARERLLAKVRMLWEKRRFLIRAAFTGMIAATLLAFLIPKRYESTAQLMPPENDNASSLALVAGLSGSGGLGTLAGDLLGVKSNGALFIGVLRSRTVLDRLVDRFDLRHVYGKKLQTRAREKLVRNTAILEDRKSGIISVSVTDPDKQLAAALAAAYVDELNSLIAQVSTSSARRERLFLEDRLAGVKQDLEAAEKDFSHFASTKGAIDIPQQGKAMVETAATLEGQLIAAQSELEGLRQIYTDQNVRVRSTQARINELKAQLNKLAGTAADPQQIDGDSALNTPYPTLRQLPILGVPYADKLRHMKVQEVIYETLTRQYELAKVQEAKEVPSVKVLDAPVVPELKSFPPRMLIMLLGTFLTTMAAVLWVLGAGYWHETDPRDPGKVLAAEVMHTIAAGLPWGFRNGHREIFPEAEAERREEESPVARGAGAGK